MANFGKGSTRHLNQLCEPLQKVNKAAIKYYDYSIVDSHRNKIRQNKYFDQGVSKVRWPDSSHNSKPAEAFDAYPYHPIFRSLTEAPSVVKRIIIATGYGKMKVLAFIREEYCIMAQTILIKAKDLDIKIRWGGDWDSDGDRLDQTFNDLSHFEIIK